jgi:hypothetical protein
MAYILTILFIIANIIGLFYWEKKVFWRLNKKTSNTIKTIHYVGMIICVFVSIMYLKFDIGLRGLWTTRIVILITLFIGIFFKFITNKSTLNKIENLYFRIFSFLPILTAGILFIPFLGIVLVASVFGQLLDPAKKVYYQDEHLRIQSTFIGVLGIPKIDIYKKDIIFEKHIKRIDFWDTEIDSVNVLYEKDSTKIVAYGLYDYDEKQNGKSDTICLTRIK